MEILYLNKNDFDDVVSSNEKPILVAFYAQWCPPCKALGAVLDKLVSDRDNTAVIAKVDIDAEPELTSKYGVTTVPTLMLFNNGEVVKSEPGFKSKEALKSFIEN